MVKQTDSLTRFKPNAAAVNADYSTRNALDRIVRCLFAEKLLDKSKIIIGNNHREALYPLAAGASSLRFENMRRFPADTFINEGNIWLVAADGNETPIIDHERLMDAVRDSLDCQLNEEGVHHFKRDVANSIHNDRLARRHRAGWQADIRQEMAQRGEAHFTLWLRSHHGLRDAATLLDQWGALEGHPYYPTWKSRPGLSDGDVTALSAEFSARVTLRVGALRADMAYCETMPHVTNIHRWFENAFPHLWPTWCEWLVNQGQRPDAWLPLPLHPWHLKHWVRTHYAQEIADGILLPDGPELTTAPSMSFRTVLPTVGDNAPFIKLPVAIWMTSEIRSLQAKSIHMGPRISAVISAILRDENGFNGLLDCFREEAAWHFRHHERKDDAEGKFLSVVFRDTSPWARPDNPLAVTVATLFTELPHRPAPLVSELISLSGQDPQSWFRHYLSVVVKPVLAMYLLYGVALEAHQQNTQILFDEQGLAQGMLIRDFGDGRTYAPLLRARGYDIKPYRWPGILPTVFEDDIEPVRTFVVDACFVSHLHELALCLTRTFAIPDHVLWKVMAQQVEKAFDELRPRLDPDFWLQERDHFLRSPWFTRSLMSMHLQQYTDYRVQHGLTNPLLSA
ncbi:IucA/IucC family protein [Budvicia diplopodorum]|uniref:IucA/IucC family protein n=1 Tax=Budvicia diplopodorum TaxID=1119056 RepID=UPI001356F40D|nr:IucA/IucC family protein [Budvicia diplopodorum]